MWVLRREEEGGCAGSGRSNTPSRPRRRCSDFPGNLLSPSASRSCLSLLAAHKSFSIYHNRLSLFLFPVFHKSLCLRSPQSAGPVWLRKSLLPRVRGRKRWWATS